MGYLDPFTTTASCYFPVDWMKGKHAFPLNDIRKKSSKNELFYSILARNLKLHGHLEMVLLLAKIKKKIISMKPSFSCTCKLP